MVKKSLDALIEDYSRLVGRLADDDYYDTKATLTLIARDDIHDRRHEMSAEQWQKLTQADSLLIRKRRIIAQVLPNPNFTDRQRWWWFLHEGPQVYEGTEKETIAA